MEIGDRGIIRDNKSIMCLKNIFPKPFLIYVIAQYRFQLTDQAG